MSLFKAEEMKPGCSEDCSALTSNCSSLLALVAG